MSFIILRHGCDECHEPVEIIGCHTSLDNALADARSRLHLGSDWIQVPLEVWDCEPGSVRKVYELQGREEVLYGPQGKEWRVEIDERACGARAEETSRGEQG